MKKEDSAATGSEPPTGASPAARDEANPVAAMTPNNAPAAKRSRSVTKKPAVGDQPAAPGVPAAPDAAVPDAPVDAASVAPRPRSRRRRLILALVLGGIGVLLIAGVGVAYGVLSARYAPSASVSAFLDQVVKGRSTEAIRLMSPGPLGNSDLMSDDIYRAAKHRITSYQIESATTKGDQARVSVKLRTDSGSWTQVFDLVTTSHVLIWNVWTVDGHDIPQITLEDTRPAGVTITANELAVQKNNADYTSYYALPGSYTFAVESDNSLVAGDSHSVSIHSMTGARDVKVQLRFRLTDDGIAAGRTAVDQYLDGCLAQATLAPTGDCGFYVENDPTGTISNIIWSITRRPVVSFDDWQDDGWTVKTDTAGVFEMDGTYRGSQGYGDVSALFTSYDVQGYLDLDQGKIVFHSTYKDGSGGQPGSGA